jgi:hypothetical protein
MENKFLTFIKPYLSFIDNGHLYRRPFSWLYTIIAILNLILPIFILIRAIDNRIFKSSGEFIVVFIIVWLIIAFAGWISFQLWWDRKSKIIDTSGEGDEFVATPVFSHLIQTVGEWLGTWIAIVGFGSALFTTLILGDKTYYLSRQIGFDFLQSGVLQIILMPVYGFLIIVFARFLAEQFRALASIANNTKK